MSAYEDQLLTARETAEMLKVSLARLYELSRNGGIPVVRVGRQVRFSSRALSGWIASGGKALGSSMEASRLQPVRETSPR